MGGGLYIQILPDPADARNIYAAIEPGINIESKDLIEMLETYLVDYVEELDDLDWGETIDRSKALLAILKRICVIVSPKGLKKAREIAEKRGTGRYRLPGHSTTRSNKN